MKKKTLAIAAIAAIAAVFATEASARTNWQGEAVTTAANAACTAEGENVGAIFKAIFLPSGITDNGNDSYMTFYGYRNAFSLRFANGRPAANKAYSAVYINTYGKNLVPAPGRFTSLTQTPAALNENTNFISMTFEVTNWAAITGCTVTLQASFVRRR